MKKVLLSLLIPLCLLVGAEEGERTIKYKSESISDNASHVYLLQYCYEGEEVVFALFSDNFSEIKKKALVVSEFEGGKQRVLRATLKDGDKEVDLLKVGGVYQVRGEDVRKIHIKVKASELHEFIRSKPREITVERFLKFQSKTRVT